MAPKKKVKTGKSVLPDSIGGSATTLSAVPQILIGCQKFIKDLYEMRHNTPELLKKGEMLPAPFLHGGTFKELAQRVWQTGYSQEMLVDSYKMTLAAGLMDPDADLDAFGAKYMTIEELDNTILA